MELIAEFVIFAAFVALCALMFGRREDFRLSSLVIFFLAVLATFVLLVVWADVSGWNERTP